MTLAFLGQSPSLFLQQKGLFDFGKINQPESNHKSDTFDEGI